MRSALAAPALGVRGQGGMSSFKRGTSFPNEGFIQAAIEAHFLRLGFVQESHAATDYIGTHPQTKERWAIEAKGQTTAIGLDFRTGLGQLVQRMDSKDTNYGIAFPDIPQFQNQVAQLAPWVCEALGIHWLAVSSSGDIVITNPSGKL